ncbi:MAG: T9SS type A sorting domain-containing protein, partial [Clostridium sp.]|nr:T9SS type A sorting domain-containing protein [Clostridium sp.]
SWSSSNTSIATVNASGVVTAVGAGTATITYTVSGGCGGTKTSSAPITVHPAFSAGTIASTGETICAGENPGVIGSTTAASGGNGVITYEWRANGTKIDGATAATYDPPAGLTTTTTYTRWAKDGLCNTTFTQSAGSWTVTVQTPNTTGLSSNDYVWIGQTSTEWNNKDNWLEYDGTNFKVANTVPTSTNNVVFRKFGTSCISNDPHISSASGTCNNITIESGNVVVMSNSKILNVSGNWSNNGTFTAGDGSVVFNGTSTQTIEPGNNAFNDVTFSNSTAGINDINIAGPMTINGACTFTNGVVYYTGSGSLSFGNSATSNIGNANSYVNGSITKIGTSPFNFAVGEGENWGPCAIAAPATNSTITAQYKHSAGPLNWSAAYMCVGSNLHHTSGVEHWLLTSTSSSTPNVTLYWNANSGVGDINSLVVAHYNEALSCWENKGASNVSGSVSSGNITNSIAFTSYSPITFGTLSSANPLPVELISFSAECNDNNEVMLSWSTASEINNDYFEIQRSTQGIAWEVIARVQGAGFSNIILDYDYLDREKPNTTTYYRLRQIDYDGSSKLSDIIQIRCENNMEKPVISVYPNPFTSSFNIEFENWDLNFAEIELLDITSRTIKKWNLENTLPNFIYEVNLSNLNPAMYMLKIKTSEGVIMRKIEKQ